MEFKVIPWADLFTNITTATTSGKGPDVLNIGNTWSATLQATGAFVPFEGEDLEAIGGKDKFLKTSFAASGAPGQGADLGPALRPVLRALLQQEAVQGGEPRAAEDVVGVRRRRQEADQGHQRRRQARPVGRRDRGRRASPRAPTSRSSSAARTAASCSTATSRRSTAPGIVKGVVGLREPDRPRQGRRPEQRASTPTARAAQAQFAKGKTGMLIYQNNAENNLKADGHEGERVRRRRGAGRRRLRHADHDPRRRHQRVGLLQHGEEGGGAGVREVPHQPGGAGDAQPVVREPAGRGARRPRTRRSPRRTSRRSTASSPTTPSRCR